MNQMFEEWEIILDAIPDPVSIHDSDFRIIKANRAFAKTVGIDAGEVIGKKCYETIHQTREPWHDCPHKQALESKKPVTEEYWEPHLGIYLKVFVSPILNEKGEVIASIHIAKDITALKRTEENARKKTDEADERVKELRCLYAFSNLLESPGISLPKIFQGLIGIIPGGWQYPEITCARIVLQDQVFKTANFKETVWKQVSPIVVDGEDVASLEICYLEERPEYHEGPFLREERDLLNALTSRLGQTIKLFRAIDTIRGRK